MKPSAQMKCRLAKFITNCNQKEKHETQSAWQTEDRK